MYDEFASVVAKFFDKSETDLIMKAYLFAQRVHENQKRASGEPYFIHPEHVAYFLIDKCHLYDANSVCAALLHDTIEDTIVTWEILKNTFNEEIANLVLGVTNCNTISFRNKTEEEKYNNSLILQSLLNDIREAYIKICDRLHNMQTLEYKEPRKRYSKAAQTQIFYVPLAYGLKSNEVAIELENLCFKYLYPEEYIHTRNIKKDFEMKYANQLEKMGQSLEKLFLSSELNFKLDIHMKPLYGIYKSLRETHSLSKIEDLITVHIVVKSEEDCYKVLELLKSNYNCQQDTIKDDLIKTELDGYQAITLMMKGFKKYRVKVEIFTQEMEMFNKYGYAIFINESKGKSFKDVQNTISTHSNFLNAIQELKENCQDNLKLVEALESKYLNNCIRIITPKEEIFILPIGATVLDLAYRIHPEIGAEAIGAYVNGKLVDINFVLEDKDKVEIVRDYKANRTASEIAYVKTSSAKRKIAQRLKEKN